MRQNPIYPDEWFNSLKIGDRVVTRGDTILTSTKTKVSNWLPKGSKGTITSINWVGPGDIGYDVQFDDLGSTWGFKHSELKAYWEPPLRDPYVPNPVYPAEWDHLGGLRGAMFDVGSRVKFIGESLSFLRSGSVGTVVSISVHNSGLNNTTYFTYNVRFDHSPDQVYWFLASELKSGYQTNPIYPEEWQHHEFSAGDYVEILPRSANGIPVMGVITCITAAGSRRWYDIRLDDFSVYNGVHERRLRWTGERRKYRNNPIYPDEWENEMRIRPEGKGFGSQAFGIDRVFVNGDKVIIKPGMPSVFSAGEGWVGTVIDANAGTTIKYHSDGTPVEIPYHRVLFIKNDGPSGDSGDPWKAASWVDADRLSSCNEDMERRIHNVRFNNNPIYPKEWGGREFKFKVGDNRTVTNSDRLSRLIGKKAYIHKREMITIGGGSDLYPYYLVEVEGQPLNLSTYWLSESELT